MIYMWEIKFKMLEKNLKHLYDLVVDKTFNKRRKYET